LTGDPYFFDTIINFKKKFILGLKENYITSAAFDQDRKKILNEFLHAIKPYSTKLNNISNEIMSLKDMNYKGIP